MKWFLPILALSVVLVGCKSGHSLDGKWTMTLQGADISPGATATADFSGGKNVAVTMDMTQKIPVGNMKIHGDLSGTYTLKDDKLSMVFDQSKLTASGLPAQYQSKVDEGMKLMSEKLRDEMNKEAANQTIKWVDDDTITLTKENGGSDTLKRVK